MRRAFWKKKLCQKYVYSPICIHLYKIYRFVYLKVFHLKNLKKFSSMNVPNQIKKIIRWENFLNLFHSLMNDRNIKRYKLWSISNILPTFTSFSVSKLFIIFCIFIAYLSILIIQIPIKKIYWMSPWLREIYFR